jgi:DNA-binding transcriptional LysR family regulator
MSAVGTPSYDQLNVFLCVVDTGSFAAAGRRLNRATSVISYTIGNLEAQLGLALFDRVGTRKPLLTPAGHAILSEARDIAHGMNGLRAKATGLLQGLEAEIHLVVDVMLPSRRLADVLKGFQASFPTVAMRLKVEALGAVAGLVLNREASIGVAGPLTQRLDTGGQLERRAAGSVELVPVASPDHPLGKASRLGPGAAREHIQLVLTDSSNLTEGQDFSVLSPRTWRLGDMSAKHALLREGIGWGNMPLQMIEGDLEHGSLVRLQMPDHRGEFYEFEAICRADTPPGPAGAWLLERFIEQG